MKGYQTMKQFMQDYKDYTIARKLDPGRDSGDTVTEIMKRFVDEKLKNASKSFRVMIKKNSYSLEDLKLIAVHDSYKNLDNFEDLISEAYEVDYVNIRILKRFLSSKAFKKGRLEKLGRFLPHEIGSKKEFRRFLLFHGHDVSYPKLKVIMKHVASKEWENWMDELIEKGEVNVRNGRFRFI